MRLSIRWIFDHISQKLDWKSFDIQDLVKMLNKITSEIEYVEHFKFDINKFTIVEIKARVNNQIRAYSSELNVEIFLPEKNDVAVGSYYLVKTDNSAVDCFSWANSNDFGSDKSYIFPAIQNTESWKNNFELEDYILVIDNKAISHRADLWGHRGFAREIAALMGYDLKPLSELTSDKSVKQYPESATIAHEGPFVIDLHQKHLANDNATLTMCKRYSSLYFSVIDNPPSNLNILSRLVRVGSKPIDFLVDLTNYVMFDLGQPIHAYDADKILSKNIIISVGTPQEKLKLLDGSEVILDSRDCVIYDGQEPIALAGIMGGSSTAVSKNTRSIFLESANFNGSSIRHSSMRLKRRTEASARFEKSLDPNQNVEGILRFLDLLDQYYITYKASESISSLGDAAEEKVIKVEASLIKKLLAVDIEPEVVKRILEKIGFGVQYCIVEGYERQHYLVTVPTFRGTKDVTIPEDIVEEVGRFIGYEVIDLKFPKRVMTAFDFKSVQNIREIKKHLAYGLKMNEVQSYAFFDEEFLKELHYEPGKTIEVSNPQSENWRRLVTSLIPNLLKVVNTNKYKRETMRFFELNRVWRFPNKSLGSDAMEAFELAGIIVEQKRNINFYECKALISSLFEFLQINVKWRKLELKQEDLGNKELESWYYRYETAALLFDNQIIGLAGMADARFLNKIIPEGRAFVFELNADFLINSRTVFKKFVPLEKYPEVHFDISIMIPDFVTVHTIEKAIQRTKTPSSDFKITKVELIDFYEKAEWGNKKSLTFRVAIYDESKTLVREEIDQIYQDILVAIQELGGIVR